MLPEAVLKDLGFLLLTLAYLSQVTAECQKIHQHREIQIPGFKTVPIHTNACKETTSAFLEPMVDLELGIGLNNYQHIYIKRYHDGCCCAVRNSSAHRISVESVDGRNIRTFKYRRIDSCTCIQCNLTSTLTQHTSIEYFQ